MPAGLHTWGGKRYRAHRIKRGRNRSRSTSAANLPRRSHDRGAPRTVRPTGNCVSNVAVHNVTCTENYTHTARPAHGSAETYPHATTVGAASPTPLPLDNRRRGFVAERYVSRRRAHRPRCAVRRSTDGAGFHAPPHLRAHPCVACLTRLTGCGRSAWPTAPASPTARPVASSCPRIISRGHSPRTILYGRTHVVLHPTPGGRGSPPLRWVIAWVDRRRCFAAPALHQPLSHGASRRDSSPFRGAEGWAEAVTFTHLFTTMLKPTLRNRP